MTTYYVDSFSGNDSNSGLSENAPWKTLNKVVTALGIGGGGSAKSHTVLLKKGSVFTERMTLYFGGLSNEQPFIFDAYGTGTKPLIDFAAGGQTRGISIASTCEGFFQFKNFAITGRGNGVEYGVLHQRTLSTDAINTIFSGVDVYDIFDTLNPARDVNGLMIRGDYFTMTDCNIQDIATDGVWVASANLIAKNLNIENVSTDGRGLGDCFQISGPSNFLVEDSVFDHSNVAAKQSFIISGAGAGSGGFLRRCQLIMKPATAGENCYPVYVDQPNVTMEQNIVTGGNNSTTYNMANFTSGAAGADVRNNLFIASVAGSQGLVIDANNAKARNNTVINTAGNAGTGYGIGQANTGRTGLEVQNNIVVGFARGIQKHTGSSWTESNNCLYNNGIAISNESGVSQAIGTGDVTSNPLLDANYKLQTGSPSLSAGIKWWTNARPSGVDGEPLPDTGIDLGAKQSNFHPFHPYRLT